MALSKRVNGMTIAAALASRATGDPERPFLFHQDVQWTPGIDTRLPGPQRSDPHALRGVAHQGNYR